jgi:hypothetical protein
MRVGPSMWDPPSCEGLLYSCCIGVVNLTFSVPPNVTWCYVIVVHYECFDHFPKNNNKNKLLKPNPLVEIDDSKVTILNNF